jgi:hypothetical protein
MSARRPGRWKLRSGEIDDELSFHLAIRVRDLVAGGAGEAEAKERALREFGDVVRVRGERGELHVRQRGRARGSRILSEGLADVSVGLRGLRRNRGYAASILTTLALVIGATAATTIQGQDRSA